MHTRRHHHTVAVRVPQLNLVKNLWDQNDLTFHSEQVLPPRVDSSPGEWLSLEETLRMHSRYYNFKEYLEHVCYSWIWLFNQTTCVRKIFRKKMKCLKTRSTIPGWSVLLTEAAVVVLLGLRGREVGALEIGSCFMNSWMKWRTWASLTRVKIPG